MWPLTFHLTYNIWIPYYPAMYFLAIPRYKMFALFNLITLWLICVNIYVCVCIYKSHQFIHLIYFYDLNLSRPGRSCSTSVMLILVIMTGVVVAALVIHSTHGGPSSHTIPSIHPSIHRFGFVPFLTNPPKLLYIQSLFNFSCHTHTHGRHYSDHSEGPQSEVKTCHSAAFSCILKLHFSH